MPQLMRSPDGGFTHAYDEGEIAKLIGLGWRKATDADRQKKKPAPVYDAPWVPIEEEVVAPKRGRPFKNK